MPTPNSSITTPALALAPALARHLLHAMLRIRRMEEKSAELYGSGQIRGFLHLYIGEEAVAAGVLTAARDDDDVVATYREHGHALLHGMSMRSIMAEMYGKQEGCCRGRGGSMHLFNAQARFYGGNAIVGGGLPLAVGLALAQKMRAQIEPGAGPEAARITLCFFGEGAMAEGAFHEAMNLAALWQLPILFCCENNLYAMGTALARSEAQTDLCAKAASYKMPTQAVDGMDVLAVYGAASAALASIRRGAGPQFLECRTYRFRAHSMFDPQLYRDQAEVALWQQRGPIHTFSAQLKTAGLLTEAEFLELDKAVHQEVADAVAFAEAGTLEPETELYRDVYTDGINGNNIGGHSEGSTETITAAVPISGAETIDTGRRRLSYRAALHDVLREALRSDPRVILIGEDIGSYGGSQAVTRDLLAEFGSERVRDTPLSELAFVGAGIGAAVGGLKPIVEIMTVNFSLLALDAIINTAATLRHMSGGQFSVPIILRMTTGAGRQLAAQHSHSFEGWYAHIPGLKIFAPATVQDARDLMRAALREPDPVLFFEHAQLYNLEQDVSETQAPVFSYGAQIRREGTMLSLITYGGSLGKCLQAAELLAQAGIDAEVLDLRVLRPLDDAAIMRTTAKTHRVLIVDEGWRSGSVSAEIIARINEQAFFELDAAPMRVCSEEVPIPYARHMEAAALPQVEKIFAAATALMSANS